MNVSSIHGSAASTPRGQAVLAALSLALASIVVALPIAFTVLLVLGLVVWVASATTLHALGAQSDQMLADAAVVAAIFLGTTTLLAGGGAATARMRGSPPGLPAATAGAASGPWLLRHPWLSASALTLLVDACLVPTQIAGIKVAPTVLLSASVLAGGAFVLLFTAYGLLRSWWFGARLLWVGARQSAFFAGMVTAGSLAISVVAFLIGQAIAHVVGPLPATSSTPTCTGSVVSCTHAALSGTRAVAQPALPPTPEVAPPELEPSFAQCIAELHRYQWEEGASARDRALMRVKDMVPDQAAAEDIVHAALLTVCSRHDRHAIRDLKTYFFAVVRNNARREWRHYRRFCVLDPEDPPQPLNTCTDASLPEGSSDIELEKAAHVALCDLPRKDRRLVEWHLWENRTHDEIARHLGIGTDAARQRYHRALKAMREKIQERCR